MSWASAEELELAEGLDLASLRSQVGANRSGRRCQCKCHSWKQTGGTILCHLLHSHHSLLRIGSNHCPLAWGSAKVRGSAWGSAKVRGSHPGLALRLLSS